MLLANLSNNSFRCASLVLKTAAKVSLLSTTDQWVSTVGFHGLLRLKYNLSGTKCEQHIPEWFIYIIKKP